MTAEESGDGPTAPAPPCLRALAEPHLGSARLLAALAAALAPDEAVAPPVRARALAALRAFGLGEAVARAGAGERRSVLASLRVDLLSAARLAARPYEAGGWTEGDPALHDAFGEASAGFAGVLAARIAPRLPGLEARLAAPGAAALDVGTGVGRLALGLARRWPGLRVIGVEPLAAVAARAREAVAAAGLAGRIEIREGRAEDLDLRSAVDLAFVPSAFIPTAQLEPVVRAAAAALRPGGWLLLVAASPGLGGPEATLLRFRVAAWGGTLPDPASAAGLLARAGLAPSDAALAIGPGLGVVAGRRPADAPAEEAVR